MGSRFHNRRSKTFHFSDTDQFFSEEDLDIANLDWPELYATWDARLLQLQSTNGADANDLGVTQLQILTLEREAQRREIGSRSRSKFPNCVTPTIIRTAFS